MRASKLLGLAIAILALGIVAVGCGGDDDSSSSDSKATTTASGGGWPIKVAYLSDCEGAFGAFYEPDIAGANTAFIKYAGGKPPGPSRSDGLDGAKVAGKDIEIVGYGCADDTADKAIEETRRLVEQEDADDPHRPAVGRRGHRGRQLRARSTRTSHVHQRHLGRAGHDAEGAGAELLPLPHGRRAVVGRPRRLRLQHARLEERPRSSATTTRSRTPRWPASWPSSARLGGQITKRIWPPLGEKDYSSSSPRSRTTSTASTTASAARAWSRSSSSTRSRRARSTPRRPWATSSSTTRWSSRRSRNAVDRRRTAGPTAADSNDPKVADYVKQLDDAYGKEISSLASSVFVVQLLQRGLGADQGPRGRQRRHHRSEKLQEAVQATGDAEHQWAESSHEAMRPWSHEAMRP